VVLCGVALSQLSQAQAGNPQPAPLTGLVPDHATISVENLDRIAEWYERVLGFKVAQRFDINPNFLLEQLSIPGYRIDLVSGRGGLHPDCTTHEAAITYDKYHYGYPGEWKSTVRLYTG